MWYLSYTIVMTRRIWNLIIPSRPVFDPRRNDPIDLTSLPVTPVNSFRSVLFKWLNNEFRHRHIIEKYNFVLEARDFLVKNLYTSENQYLAWLTQPTKHLLHRASQDISWALKKVDYYTQQLDQKNRSPEHFSGLMTELDIDLQAVDKTFHELFFNYYSTMTRD
jgi:hypothetical protein